MAAQTTTTQASSTQPNLHALMMDATFRIYGPTSSPSVNSTGTGFLMGKPDPSQTGRFFYVLVTAAHVLDGIQGESARLVVRTKDATTQHKREEVTIRIRSGATPLWTKHKTADVAVMFVGLPDNVSASLIPPEFLALDADFEQLEINPGDEVFTVGYPHGHEVNSLGFPVLRSGRIASYPMTPATKMNLFQVDFNVFGGNSGGAIYLNQLGRLYGGTYHMDQRVFKVLGLVSNQVTLTATGERLNVAGIVYAHFIKETLEQLPPKPGGS